MEAPVDCLQFSVLQSEGSHSGGTHVAVHPAWLTAAATQQKAMATLVNGIKQWACSVKDIKGKPTAALKVGCSMVVRKSAHVDAFQGP
jgi:hypothetical protein